MRLMRDYPDKQRERYQQEWANAVNRFTRDLLNDFADADGTLNWEKIVQFNSSAE